MCGGTAIAAENVLTAGHCFADIERAADEVSAKLVRDVGAELTGRGLGFGVVGDGVVGGT